MRRWLGLVLSSACFASACGGGSSDEEGPDPCVSAAETVCQSLSQCSPFWFARIWDDMVACQNDLRHRCRAEVNAPGSGVTSADVQACAAERSASCELVALTEASDAAYWGGLPFTAKACGAPIGSLAVGKACGFDSQCASGRCRIATDGCLRCVAGVGEGVACVSPGGIYEVCAAGLECIDGSCQKPRYAGEACTSPAQCAGMLACVDGTCAVNWGGSVGTPCGAGFFCDPLTGLVCGTSLTCEQLVLTGEAEPCDPIRVCRAGLVCADGTCAKSPIACTDSAECNGGTCRWRACLGPPPAGACP